VQQSGVGVEAESWTECELNWAGPKSSGYFCICCTRRSHFIDTDTAEIWVHQRLRNKKKTPKVWLGFFGNSTSQHDIILSFCESEFEPIFFSCSSPAATKKHKNWSLFYFRFISQKYFLFPFGPFSIFFGQRCFHLVFFWVIPKKYVRKRQWKRNRVLVKVGCPSRNGNRKRITSAWLSRSVDHMVGPWRIDCVMAAWVDRPQK